MIRKMESSSTVDQLLISTSFPYSAKVMAIQLPPKFWVPPMETYDGTRDLVERFETFKANMTLHRFLEEVAYKAFSLTLRGLARTWFGSLALGSIENFDELACLFLTHFMANRRRRRLAAFLLTIKQREDENLKTYLVWFNKEWMTTEDQEEKITLAALLREFGLDQRSWQNWPKGPPLPSENSWIKSTTS